MELQATGAYEAPCCDDRHATEVMLYTGDRENDPRRYQLSQFVALAAVEWIDSAVQELQPCVRHCGTDNAPPTARGEGLSCALRAPPYTA